MNKRSEAREIVEDGGCCSCHLTPPCEFCVVMTEDEITAYIDGGIPALHALWECQDDGERNE